MAFAPISIPGVAGVIETESSFWAGYKFFVEGQRIKPRGFARNKLTFPGVSGTLEAKIKGGLFRAHPILVADGKEYTTGPPTPGGLQALALLPALSILVFQGLLGFLLAFGSVAVNMGIIRSTRTNGVKAALLAGTFAVVALIDVLLVIAVVSTTN